ncbi:MAG: Phosphoglucosamine mutase (EC [uncultured Campylobacterales bacterium]|uniref:Phosphoglucosamine mutase n=1 Tax=uncultured Campylobacterales bacterium TaxID=352960 RepID=A0A6S6TC70_9BACT|nr:MAG: Phosphoglucosamine mutase (EC [uncultured Campylobacterales bacterium]
MKLFGTDGVRGEAGGKLTASVALRLAMAGGIYFRKFSQTNKIIIGKDTRRSGYMIENAMVSGLLAVGYDVKLVGPLPTPAVAFLSENMRCDAGIMISASHNPYYDNGIKFFDSKGNKLGSEIEDEIEKIYHNDELIEEHQQTLEKIGVAKRIEDAIGRYIVHIKNSFPHNLSLAKVRIVVDVANGAAYKVAPTIFRELGAELIVINESPNGLNINQNSGAMHPEILQNMVKEYRADIGFALDGDADRLVVVTEDGEIADGDKLLGALAVYLKSKNELKNNAISATIMSNKALQDYLNTQDIKLHRCNVGDKHVLQTLQKQDLNFGGEQSGHVIFSDYAKTGDGLVSALQVLAFMLESKKKASEILNPFDLYPQKLTNLKVNSKKDLNKLEGYNELIKEIEDKDIYQVIRYSGTENLLRILLESKNQKDIDTYTNKCIEFFEKNL